MNVNIDKKGVLTTENIYEPGLYFISSGSAVASYKPANNGTNQCIEFKAVRFNGNRESTYIIELDVSWSGTFAQGTNGTFNARFHGSNYSITESKWVWNGANYLTNALNNTQSLKNLLLSSPSGSYHYIATATIPNSWFDTYDGSWIGTRIDYSNGNGTLTYKNLKIYPKKTFGGINAHVSEDHVAGNYFYEI